MVMSANATEGNDTEGGVASKDAPLPWKVRILHDKQTTVAQLQEAGEEPEYIEWVRSRYLSVLEQADNDPLVDQLEAGFRELRQEIGLLRDRLEETRARLDRVVGLNELRDQQPRQRELFVEGECGECCRNLIIEILLEDAEREPRIKERGSPIKGFTNEVGGYLLNKSGPCVFLDEATNLCSIHETRPLVGRRFNCDGEDRQELVELGILPPRTGS